MVCKGTNYHFTKWNGLLHVSQNQGVKVYTNAWFDEICVVRIYENITAQIELDRTTLNFVFCIL